MPSMSALRSAGVLRLLELARERVRVAVLERVPDVEVLAAGEVAQDVVLERGAVVQPRVLRLRAAISLGVLPLRTSLILSSSVPGARGRVVELPGVRELAAGRDELLDLVLGVARRLVLDEVVEGLAAVRSPWSTRS